MVPVRSAVSRKIPGPPHPKPRRGGSRREPPRRRGGNSVVTRNRGGDHVDRRPCYTRGRGPAMNPSTAPTPTAPATGQAPPALSVFLPIYNEELNLAPLHQRLTQE